MRRRVTYANITATLALFFAMSGGALAAKHYLINSSSQINPKVLKALKGNVGARGETGSPGKEGPLGPKGETGAPGGQGREGKEGAKGALGIEGTEGKQGPKGETGATGLEGKEGKEGKEGRAARPEGGPAFLPCPTASRLPALLPCCLLGQREGDDAAARRGAVFPAAADDHDILLAADRVG